MFFDKEAVRAERVEALTAWPLPFDRLRVNGVFA